MLSITTHPPSPADPVSADRLVGNTVGHYVVVSRLAGGGQGVVYLARDTKLNRPVALKFLPRQLRDDEHANQRFIREAQAGAAARHRNICTIHAFESTDDGQPFIVMAYYEGQTLKQRLHGGALPAAEAVDIAAQVAEGLTTAHENGVVHRDIKPGNLMLTAEGVKILDFGLARLADTLQLTTEGSLLGTAIYMSPEQARCEDTNSSSDIWSLGVVLYEMLAGEAPFKGTHPDAICYAIRNDQPPRLAARAPGLSPDLERLVTRALCKVPSGRPSAVEMARALRNLQKARPAFVWAARPPAMSGRSLPRLQSWRMLLSNLTPTRTALVTAASVATRALKSSISSFRDKVQARDLRRNPGVM